MSLKKKIVWTVVLGVVGIITLIFIVNNINALISSIKNLDKYYFTFTSKIDHNLPTEIFFNKLNSRSINLTCLQMILNISSLTAYVYIVLRLWLPSKNFIQRSYEEYQIKKQEQKQQRKQNKLDKKKKEIAKLQQELNNQK